MTATIFQFPTKPRPKPSSRINLWIWIALGAALYVISRR